MLSKHITNVIQNLEKKKYRDKYNLFKVEGEKLVEELLRSDLETDTLVATSEWRAAHEELVGGRRVAEATREEMARVSNFQSPPEVLALARIPAPADPPDNIRDTLSLLLNGIQDPGNMGTILRTADALGIDGIIISSNSCDVFSPKVIRGTMGAVFRLPIFITDDICGYIKRFNENGCSYATVPLNADKAVTEIDFKSGNVIAAIGNEGNGLTKECIEACSCKITIPMTGNAESLNAGIAAGIVMWEMVR